MTTRIVASVAVILAFSSSVAYAATLLSSSEGTQVCVNNTNGLVRVASTCRVDEHAITIGGGSGAAVTQKATYTVPLGETEEGRQLPLTGVTLSGRCFLSTPPPGFGEPQGRALFVIQAASGQTMDAFGPANPGSTLGGSSVVARLTQDVGAPPVPTASAFGWANWVLTSNGATVTVTVGAWIDWGAQACTYLWQAVEASN